MPEPDAQPHISCPFCGGALEATRTDWSCVNGHRGRNLTLVEVHDPTCLRGREVMAAGQGKAMQAKAADGLALPHSCLPGGFAGAFVIQTEVLVAPHPYRPGMTWPAGEKGPRCRGLPEPAARAPAVSVESLRRTLDLACKLSDRWLVRYVAAIHRPCPECGHVPGPVEDPPSR